MLDAFRAILDGDEPPPPGSPVPSEEELTRALQVILKGQCIYAATSGIGRSYELARHYAPFFRDYFACLGYRFEVAHRDQMVFLALPPEGVRHDAQGERLRKDETLVLLALRLAYEEGLRDSRVATDGTVECTTDDIADSIRSAARSDPPDEARLIEILRLFSRKGALRLGERDRLERVTPLTVMPGIAVLSPDAWMDQVRAWASAGEGRSGGESPFQVRNQRAHPRRSRQAGRHDEVQRDGRGLPVGHHPFQPARAKVVPNGEIRLDREAEPGPERGREGVGVVGAQRPLRDHGRGGAGRVGKMPAVRGRQIGVAEAGMASQVVRVLRPAVSFEVAGGGHQRAAHAAEPPHPERGIGQRRDPQAEIEAAADEIDLGIREVQVDGDLREGREEVRKHRRDMGHPERHRRGEPHPPPRRTVGVERPRLRRLAGREQVGGILAGGPAGLRQGEATRGAVEQACAEPRFQPRHGLRHGRLRQTEIVGGTGEGQAFRDRGEDRPGLEIRETGHSQIPKRYVSIVSVFAGQGKGQIGLTRISQDP